MTDTLAAPSIWTGHEARIQPELFAQAATAGGQVSAPDTDELVSAIELLIGRSLSARQTRLIGELLQAPRGEHFSTALRIKTHLGKAVYRNAWAEVFRKQMQLRRLPVRWNALAQRIREPNVHDIEGWNSSAFPKELLPSQSKNLLYLMMAFWDEAHPNQPFMPAVQAHMEKLMGPTVQIVSSPRSTVQQAVVAMSLKRISAVFQMYRSSKTNPLALEDDQFSMLPQPFINVRAWIGDAVIDLAIGRALNKQESVLEQMDPVALNQLRQQLQSNEAMSRLFETVFVQWPMVPGRVKDRGSLFEDWMYMLDRHFRQISPERSRDEISRLLAQIYASHFAILEQYAPGSVDPALTHFLALWVRDLGLDPIPPRLSVDYQNRLIDLREHESQILNDAHFVVEKDQVNDLLVQLEKMMDRQVSSFPEQIYRVVEEKRILEILSTIMMAHQVPLSLFLHKSWFVSLVHEWVRLFGFADQLSDLFIQEKLKHTDWHRQAGWTSVLSNLSDAIYRGHFREILQRRQKIQTSRLLTMDFTVMDLLLFRPHLASEVLQMVSTVLKWNPYDHEWAQTLRSFTRSLIGLSSASRFSVLARQA